MVVPDSRSKLWIDPYDLPVEATKDLMLAPFSYALRSSLSSFSRVSFMSVVSVIRHLPTCRLTLGYPTQGHINTLMANFYTGEKRALPCHGGGPGRTPGAATGARFRRVR